MNPNSTPFGYSIGINYGACAYRGLNAVSINLAYIMNTKSPQDLYKTLFHEMGHIRQFRTNSLSHRLTMQNVRAYRAKDGSQTSMQWKASPNEFTANHFAYKQLIKVNKAMLKNPETRVQAAQNIKDLKANMVENVFNHIKGIAHITFVSPFQKLFGINPQEKIIGNTNPKGPRMLNLQEIREFIVRHPAAFNDPTNMKQDGTLLREFIAARNDEAHMVKNFFTEHRSYNTQQNNEALEQFNNGQPIQISPDEEPTLISQQNIPPVEPLHPIQPKDQNAPPVIPQANLSTNVSEMLRGILNSRTLQPEPQIQQDISSNIQSLQSAQVAIDTQATTDTQVASNTDSSLSTTTESSIDCVQS